MSTPLQRRRRLSREFEKACGIESRYTKPWNPATNLHPIALALPSYATPASPVYVPKGRDQ